MNACVPAFVWVPVFTSSGYVSRGEIAGPHGHSTFNFLRTHQIVVPSHGTTSHSHQPRVRIAGSHSPLHGENLPNHEANAEARRHDSRDNTVPVAVLGAAGLIKPELILPFDFSVMPSYIFPFFPIINEFEFGFRHSQMENSSVPPVSASPSVVWPAHLVHAAVEVVLLSSGREPSGSGHCQKTARISSCVCPHAACSGERAHRAVGPRWAGFPFGSTTS